MIRAPSRLLLNTPHVEIWPGGLLQARSNHDARLLSRATAVLRRKRDGCYLAAVLPQGLMPMVPRLSRETGIDAALNMLDAPPARHCDPDTLGHLPIDGLLTYLQHLGLDQAYGERTGLELVAEPVALSFAGHDRYRRPLWLTRHAATGWLHMQQAARKDGITLDAISGYRSHDYQLGIFERKFARGQTLEQILSVNAAPGYSEHHSGDALDIGTPGEPPAEESFETTPAFAWLSAHAGDFGFTLSYPRDNPHGIVYEPWHWRHQDI